MEHFREASRKIIVENSKKVFISFLIFKKRLK